LIITTPLLEWFELEARQQGHQSERTPQGVKLLYIRAIAVDLI
jgi:hypothetical protein